MLVYTYEISDPKQPLSQTGMGAPGRLVSFKPPPLDPTKVIGREIVGWIPYAGMYGMGGPGFVGFNLKDEWLVVAVWGAAEWMRLDGRLLQDIFSEKYGRDPGWNSEPEEVWQNLFTGRRFAEFSVERTSLRARLDDGRPLLISDDPNDRPLLEGNGNPREIGADDDLRRVVFLAPTAEIWV